MRKLPLLLLVLVGALAFVPLGSSSSGTSSEYSVRNCSTGLAICTEVKDSIGAYGAYTVGLGRVPASVAGIVTLLEPLTATILGVALFGERLGAPAVVGAGLLVGALGLLLSDGEAR